MTHGERIAEITDALRELRALDTGDRVFGSAAHRYALRPPLAEEGMDADGAGEAETLSLLPCFHP